MQVYTGPRLLDVHGALDALPALPLDGGEQAAEKATGTMGAPEKFAPKVAPTPDARGQAESSADNLAQEEEDATIAVSAEAVNEKGPLSSADSGPVEWALRDSNPRPHGCDPCALAS